MKEVIIRLGEGELVTGFNTVSIELKHAKKTRWEDRAHLTAAPELRDLLNQWQLLYPAVLNLSQNDRHRSPVFDDDTITNISIQDIKELNHNFQRSMNDWLDQGSFNRIIKRLRSELNPQDRIVITIVSELQQIWKLPWHFWDIFQAYPHAVEVFCKPRFTNIQEIEPQRNGTINILGLFGEDPVLELNPEFLNTLPQAASKIITTTSAYEIADLLTKNKPWGIFIFNGHGDTIESDPIAANEGIIYLDNHTPLEISRLKIEMERAIDRGLQIAIFNCCSGLGLAEQLSDVNLPYIIVMREKIPDRVAQQFLADLLTQYSHGDSFPEAFREARRRLILADGSFARFADWLPVLFHNPLSHHVTWQDLAQSKFSLSIPPQLTHICQYLSQPKRQIWTSVGMNLFVGILALYLKNTPPIIELNFQIDEQIQLMEAAKIQPNTSKVTIVNYQEDDSINIFETSNNANRLVAEIDRISRQFKPLFWLVDVDFAVGDLQLDRANIIKGCTALNRAQDRLNYSRSEISCDPTSEAFRLLSTQPYFQQLSQQDLKLNPHLLTKIDSIDIDKIEKLPFDRAKQLFDNKIIVVGIVRDRNSLVNRDALALDRLNRASDSHQPLPLFMSWQIGIELLWILLWSIAISIAAWRPQWRLLVPIIVCIQIAISGWLLSCGQGVPIAICTIAILLAIAIILSIKQLARSRYF